MQLQRGQSARFDVNLDESLASSPLTLERSYRIVSGDGGALVVVLDDEGLRCQDAVRRAAVDQIATQFGTSLVGRNRLDLALEPAAKRRPVLGLGAFGHRPFVVSPAVDLNADGVADVVLAARHQACLMAFSGQDGTILWVAARGHDLDSRSPMSRHAAYRGS